MNFGRLSVLGLVFAIPVLLASSGLSNPHKTIYDYSLVSLDGKEISLASFKGKVLLIVNLASQSIYDRQIAELENLQKAYGEKGLLIIGIPSGDFGAQELPDNSAIQRFYLDKEHVTFTIFSKASLRGKDSIPLVRFLTDPKSGLGGGDIHWNFTKFLVNRQGEPVARFEADSDPDDPEFRVTVEQLLDGTYKKKDAVPKGENGSSQTEDDRDGD